MSEHFFDINVNPKNGPLVATAIHEGHELRPNLQEIFNLGEEERRREEDPFTGEIARQFDNHILVNRSRFEVDLNRPLSKAVYRRPEDAWGLHVWKESLLPDHLVEESMELYHTFYQQVEKKLSDIVATYGYMIVYDFHSYNYRREGADAPPANPKGNPDIDVLTTNIQLDIWGPVLKEFKQVLEAYPYPDGRLDVREDIRFEGEYSHFMQWVLSRFGEKVFVPSIEIKKIFMDEWTGTVYNDKLEHLKKVMKQTVPAVLQEANANEKITESL